MKIDLYHEIYNDPEPEDAGTIKIIARIFGEDENLMTFSTSSFTKDFIDDENDECRSKEALNYFLMEAGIDDDVITDAMLKLIVRVDEITCPSSIEYSPGCALEVRLNLLPDYLDDDDDLIRLRSKKHFKSPLTKHDFDDETSYVLSTLSSRHVKKINELVAKLARGF